MGKTLTADVIQTKCKTDKIANIKNLNLWGNDIDDLSIIKEMPNIEICSLSLNKIHSLKDFANLKKLTELYLRKNLITDLTEVKYLQYCPQLKVLWLWDNPIAEHPLYRPYIIKLLPHLMKLDNAAVTQEEKTEAMAANITD
jgi:Leucine-rich repeat (LRR) protein